MSFIHTDKGLLHLNGWWLRIRCLLLPSGKDEVTDGGLEESIEPQKAGLPQSRCYISSFKPLHFPSPVHVSHVRSTRSWPKTTRCATKTKWNHGRITWWKLAEKTSFVSERRRPRRSKAQRSRQLKSQQSWQRASRQPRPLARRSRRQPRRQWEEAKRRQTCWSTGKRGKTPQDHWSPDSSQASPGCNGIRTLFWKMQQTSSL